VRIADNKPASTAASAHQPVDGQAARRRVLVVDDHRDAARILSLLLDTLGHDVRTANTGEQALDEVAHFDPEVVFLDIGLPRIDGYEVARQLRAREPRKHRTLVALTGWGHDDDRKRSREAGFDHHLVKPVNVKTLKDLLEAA
jgi:CheY-like chemotaxis protein